MLRVVLSIWRAVAVALITALVAVIPAAANAASVRTTPTEHVNQLLWELSESKNRRVSGRCVPQRLLGGGKDWRTLGMARVGGNIFYVSSRYVCTPLAQVMSDRFNPRLTRAQVDAIVTVAHEWFHTRGVSREHVAECHAVRWAWKWLKRSGPYTNLEQMRRFLLDNSYRPVGYKLAPTCRLL